MHEMDKMIRDALREEDAILFDSLDSQSLPEMVIETFRGKSRWLVVMVTVGMTALFLGAVVFGAQLWRTTELLPGLRYAVGFLFCCLGVGMLKTWYWMELNKHAMLREMKRLEWQVARLDERSRTAA